ncbi:GntR family transcriptional regulator [Streptomyces sp. GQFP]|uniref:GntR family transcriptional regulator n=1 Tax=Streptomyces sp. GQFP TaxID=2907545 RepID=UPI001F27E5D4|nr:GntR family transcriptional regulator [Streptomyces sp. GQFP]UIX34276.1 GntR family transcriptional regulator [Streptomyces sp. GQFP]
MTSGEPYTEPVNQMGTGAHAEERRRTHASDAPPWHQHLKELPVYTPGVRLTHDDRARYAYAVTAAHRAGGSMLGIAAFLGCPFALVHRLVDLGKGFDEASEAHRVETVLRSRIADGTYQVGDVLPSRERLCVELGVLNDSVRRALARLVHAGLTLGIPALGTVVMDPDTPPPGSTLQVRKRSGQIQTWTLPSTESPRIRDVITGRIKDGTYPEGSRIPGTKALTEEFGTTDGTLKSALRPLKRLGILSGTRQEGTFVHSSALGLLTEALKKGELRMRNKPCVAP